MASVIDNNKSGGENVLTKYHATSADKETKAIIRKMSEKELLQSIAYDVDKISTLIRTYFTVFTIVFIILAVFTFVGPLVQKAAGL